ncbi:hypothetical protein RFI_23131, partial [Reticulomyxa filosa]
MGTSATKAQKFTDMDDASPFQTVASLPIPLRHAQCVVHKHEILICGGYNHNVCYSYHTVKNQYKRICSYPKYLELTGHYVVRHVTSDSKNDKEILLLSFGQSGYEKKYILAMRYISVWEKDKNKKLKNKHNKWQFLTDNNDQAITIVGNEDNFVGARATIGGENKHLLFITYYPNNISVYNLNTWQYVKHATLPVDSILISHCFVSKNHKKKKSSEMMLFNQRVGLSIEYDEDNNVFNFQKVRVCKTIGQLCFYGYVCVNNSILFFGGKNGRGATVNEVYQYSISDDKWTKYEQTLPMALRDCTVVLSDDNAFVHIIGGFDGENKLAIHMKADVKNWIRGEQQLMIEDQEIVDIEKIHMELEGMNHDLDIKKLKVLQFQNCSKQKEIEKIIEYWMRSSSINKMGWIPDFNFIVLRYIL